MYKILLVFLSSFLFALSTSDVTANYWMDECYWGEAIDHSGNGYNATAQNEANTTDGGIIFRDGNLTNTNYLSLNTNIPIDSNYTIKFWAKWPFDTASHTAYKEGSQWWNEYYYFNIADRPGSDSDFVYFKKRTSQDRWYWCVGTTCNRIGTSDISDGWHMFTFVVDKDANKTTFYLDDSEFDSIDLGLFGEISLIGSSDFNDDEDGQTIGSIVDEYIVFNKDLNSTEVEDVYNNELLGKNFDGTKRYNTTISPLEMEAGRVTLINTYNDPVWTHVDFNKTFSSVPVIFSVATKDGSQPASIRFKNITTTGFDVLVVEPEPMDGPHISQTIDYIAITPGLHLLDGHYIDVKVINTKKTQYGPATIPPSENEIGWERVSLDVPMCNGVVISNIQTLNNLISDIPNEPMKYWDTSVLKVVDSSNIDVALDISEVNDSIISNEESVGILAIDGNLTGSFVDDYDNNITYETQFVPKYFRGWDNTKEYVSFLNDYSDTPLCVGWKMSRYGNNGGWARRYDISSTEVSFVTDEDTYHDDERSHIKEDYGFLVFSKPFHISFKPVGEWRMDECEWNGVSGEVRDSSGNDLNGTALNDANTSSISVLCRSGDFNADNNQSVDIKASSKLELNESLTYMAWIKIKDPSYVGNDDKLENIFTNQSWANALRYTEKGYFYRGNKENRILFQLSIDGSEEYLYSDTQINDTSWHHVAATYDGESMKIYIDGVLDVSLDVSGSIDTDSADNIIAGEYGNYYFNGYIDELKVFNKALSASAIKIIYDNEKEGKSWDGKDRVCNKCSNYESGIFNAVDYVNIDECNALDDWDDNISTKWVNDDFNLTLLAKDDNSTIEANITKVELYKFESVDCSGEYQKVVICDDSTSNPCPNTNSNGCAILKDLNITNANKCIKVHIVSDVNESNSTDSFATIPYRFLISAPSTIVAAKEFNVTIKAVDKNLNPVKDYNETLSKTISPKIEMNETNSDCLNGDFEIVSGGEFRDGEANVTLKYLEVGDVNISVFEVNGSEFALTDENDSVKFILKDEKNLVSVVSHFDVNESLKDFDKFTYLDDNVTMAAFMDVNISAKNEDNQTLKNYNSKCYAKDIDINISLAFEFNNPSIEVNKTRYYFFDATGAKSALKEGELSIRYLEGNFTTDNNGSTNIKIYFNFDKNSSLFSNPFVVKVKEINVSNEDTSLSYSTLDGNATFYYGYVLVDDVITKQNEVNNSFYFVVYDENKSDPLLMSKEELEVNLYKNIWHTLKDGNFSVDDIVISKDYNASNDITSDFDIYLGDISSGEVNISVVRKSNVNFAVVHILSPNLRWLWYSRFQNKYDISSSSTCLNHFCFSITYENSSSNSSEVGSGTFVGVESNITEENSTKRGVKIFR